MADQRPPAPAGGEPSWKRWGLSIVGVVLVLFMALNSQEVEVKFIFGTAQMPLIFALLVAAALGALVGWAVPRIRRKER